jgi:DNA-binding NtrC family response regulator
MRVLVADDDKNLRKVLSMELQAEGYEVDAAESGSAALERLKEEEYDVLVLDLNMPGMDGMEVLKDVKGEGMLTEVIVLTADATATSAVEAMKLGAYDYITKPLSIEELKAVAEKAYEKRKLLSENLLLRTQLKSREQSFRIVGESDVVKRLLETVRKIAASDFPVLITGESGTGKELVARAIHDASDRAGKPFVALNCGAIPGNMIENELFGHEKGAFTGAHERKPGLLEIAHEGTLFLDEICELDQQLQSKLLRVIETQKFFRVGGTREVKVNVRFISATNRDVREEVDSGNFRADLYYRISALTLPIAPLRERKEDIPVLIEHFISGNPAFRGKRFSEDALKVLSNYSWPGNVRELQNVVNRLLLLSSGEVIEIDELCEDMGKENAAVCRKLADVEREHILKTLEKTDGHRGKAAEILGIDPKTLYRKLQSYGLKE